MKQQDSYFLRLLGFIVLAAAITGGIFGTTFTTENATNIEVFAAFLRGVYTGTIIAMPLTIIEVALSQTAFTRWRQSRPFLIALLIDSVLYTVIVTFGLWSGAWLFAGPEGSDFGWNRDSGIQMLFAFIVSVIINLFIVINRIIGPGVMLNIAMGRYHQPVEEERVILFIDIKGSTRIAEQLGDLAFHRLLNRFYSDVTDAVLRYHGTIHKYVGDEIIISWRAGKASSATHAVQCHRFASEIIGRNREEYEKQFGVIPEFRAALHVGPVVIGEMGNIKLEIAFSGDAMNTTGRLMDLCRELTQDCIASAALLDQAELPDTVAAHKLPSVKMRGKEKPIAVSALRPVSRDKASF